MFEWLKNHAPQDPVDLAQGIVHDQLSNRLRRIVADHTPVPGERKAPVQRVILLLPPPDYRREYIGRYDWSRRTIFPFDY